MVSEEVLQISGVSRDQKVGTDGLTVTDRPPRQYIYIHVSVLHLLYGLQFTIMMLTV